MLYDKPYAILAMVHINGRYANNNNNTNTNTNIAILQWIAMYDYAYLPTV